MKHLTFWFDPISPFAYLAFEQLPQALEGLSYEVAYRPILFAGLLKHWGQKGPAEIEPKRDFTFRHAAWLARRDAIRFEPPLPHPFNPLALLRLLLASGGAAGAPNRRACEAVLRHVWQGGGADPNEPARLRALTDALAPPVAADDASVKQALHDATAQAIGRGVFGVPTVEVDGALYWGLDALPMLADALRGAAAVAPGAPAR